MTADARDCPRCGARGILPLDQPRDSAGAIPDPVMLCPVCGEEYRAEGMRALGLWEVANMTDEEIEQLADEIIEWSC